VLGHSAGANLATLYAARYPQRVRRLALITPSLRAVGIVFSEEYLREAASARTGEPWFAAAMAAADAVFAGAATAEEEDAVVPFFYGRWDTTAQEHAASAAVQTNDEAAERYAGEGAFDPPATKKALADLTAPVLLLAGEVDGNPLPRVAREAATFFPKGEAVVQPGAGHFPWLDDADHFTRTVAAFFS
jgi:pimeloyl-ACP methyl ester carboxylesterase